MLSVNALLDYSSTKTHKKRILKQARISNQVKTFETLPAEYFFNEQYEMRFRRSGSKSYTT